MLRIFFKTVSAQIRRRFGLYALTLVGVAMGVASVVAVQLINQNAISAFEGGIQAVTGEVDLRVTGYGPSIPESHLPDVLATEGVKHAWPVLRSQIQTDDGLLLDLLALDLTRPAWSPGNEEEFDPVQALFTPGWSMIDVRLARRMAWEMGHQVLVSSGSRTFELFVGAVVDFSTYSPGSSANLVVMDIGQAQSLLGRKGEIQEISIQLRDKVDRIRVSESLEKRLGSGVEVLTPVEQKERSQGLLDAFRLNLTALSLISLFVGVFLIYSSTQASLIRRRKEFGLLRSLGATPFQVFGLILGEIGVLALLGVLIGLPLGYWAAYSRISSVNSTLTNIYLLQGIQELEIPAYIFWLGVTIGVVSSVAGAFLPAVEISRQNTTLLMTSIPIREKISTAARPLFFWALGILAMSGLLYIFFVSTWKHIGFALGIALLVALPLATPLTILKFCNLFKIKDFGFSYSIRSLADRIQNTSFAVASLGIAVSMLVGITLMIASFRETVGVWVNTTIVADMYVTSRSWRGAGSAATIDPQVIDRLGLHPGVGGIDRIRTFPMFLEGRRVLISGVDLTVEKSRSRYPLLAGHPNSAFSDLDSSRGIFLSEPFSRKTGLSVGDTIALPGKNGLYEAPIAAVVYDYTSESGLIVMSFDLMNAVFGPGDPNSLALYLNERVAPDGALEELQSQFQSTPLRIISNEDLRSNVFKIFDETFAVVRILQLMSLLIAASGITLTLLILAQERSSELALYRAIGAKRSQIFKLYVGKGLAIAGFSSVLGSFGGLGLAFILVFLINRAYFGWTIQVSMPWVPILSELLIIMGAALLASLYPALRASQTPARELSRDDL